MLPRPVRVGEGLWEGCQTMDVWVVQDDEDVVEGEFTDADEDSDEDDGDDDSEAGTEDDTKEDEEEA